MLDEKLHCQNFVVQLKKKIDFPNYNTYSFLITNAMVCFENNFNSK